MSTSIHKAYLRTGRTWDGNAPVDAAYARDVVLNNACHAADSFGQVRVNFTRMSAAIETGDTWSAANLGNLGAWKLIGRCGPFPVPLRLSGKSYRYRVRIAGASLDGSTTNVYRIVLAPAEFAEDILTSADDGVYEATASSTTGAWLTGASQGSNAWANMMEISADKTAAWTRADGTVATVGGAAVTVSHVMVSASVFGRTTFEDPDVEDPIVVHGLYIAEWIGT